MPALGAGELLLLRQHPYTYKGYMYIYQPEVVFQAQTNRPQGFGSGTAGFSQIDFDNVTTGSYTDIQVGMTILFGSTPGARDLGWTYIQQPATSSLIYTGLSPKGRRRGEIDLADNIHITVLRLWEIWAKTPYIPPYPADNTYRDNTNYGPQVAMPPCAVAGSDVIGYVDASTGKLEVDFNAGNSYAVAEGASIASYLWNFGANASPTSSTTSIENDVQFNPGVHWISLTVTDDQSPAQSHTTWRMVVALDGSTTVPKPTDIDNLVIRSRAEGQVLECDLYEALSSTQYPPGTRILYGEDEWYNGLKINLVGETGRKNLRFSGWLDTEPVDVDISLEGNLPVTRLTARDAAGCLARLKSFPLSVRRNNASTRWEEMRDATIDRLAHHIGHWLSTVTYCADFQVSGTHNTYPFAHMDSEGSDLYDQLDQVAQAIGYRMTCDQRGRMRMVVDPFLQESADRTATIIMELEETDWSRLNYSVDERPRVGVIRSNGSLTSISNATDAPVESLRVLSIAPNPRAYGQGGGTEDLNGWLVTSQTESNNRLGQYYARVNSIYSLYEVELAHTGDAGIDPALMEWVRLKMGTRVIGQRQLALTTARWLPTELLVEHEATAGGWTKTVSLTCEFETTGTGAFTDDGMVTTQPVYTPPATTNPPLTINTGSSLGTGTIALILDDGTLARTGPTVNGSGFSAAYPDWDTLDLKTLSGWGGGTSVIDFAVDPYSPLYLGTGSTVNGWIMLAGHVQRVTDIFGTTALGTAHALPFTVASGCMSFERGVQNWGICVQHRNAASGGTSIAYTTDGLTWTNVNINANYENNSGTNGNIWTPGLAISPHSAGRAYVTTMLGLNTLYGSGFQGYVTTDYGATWSLLSTSTCNITDGEFNAGTIVVPYQNAAMTTAYYGGRAAPGGANQIQMLLFRAIGATQTDISPIVASNKYGIDYTVGNRQVAVADSDQNTVVLCGTYRENTVSATRYYGVFLSRDQGATWTTLITPTTTAADQPYRQVYIQGDNPNVFYLIGISGAVAQVSDGLTVVNRKGNLSTNATVIGLCGG